MEDAVDIITGPASAGEPLFLSPGPSGITLSVVHQLSQNISLTAVACVHLVDGVGASGWCRHVRLSTGHRSVAQRVVDAVSLHDIRVAAVSAAVPDLVIVHKLHLVAYPVSVTFRRIG